MSLKFDLKEKKFIFFQQVPVMKLLTISFFKKVEKDARQNLFSKNRKSLFPRRSSFLANILAK
jgi:hypothetical protein